MPFTNEEFGKAVEVRRLALGMSRSELARAMGTRADVVGMLERGARTWNLKYMNSAAAGLRTSLIEILGGKPDLSQLERAVVAVMRTSGRKAAISVLLDSLEET